MSNNKLCVVLLISILRIEQKTAINLQLCKKTGEANCEAPETTGTSLNPEHLHVKAKNKIKKLNMCRDDTEKHVCSSELLIHKSMIRYCRTINRLGDIKIYDLYLWMTNLISKCLSIFRCLYCSQYTLRIPNSTQSKYSAGKQSDAALPPTASSQ